MSEVFRVAIHSAENQKLIAGPIHLGYLPRQEDVLFIDGVYHQVKLVEIDYKNSEEPRAYVVGLGRHDEYSRLLPSLLKK